MGRFVTSFLSIYLVSALHLGEGVVGAVVAMYGFGAIIGCLFGGALSDRFGRQSMIIIGEIGAAAALLVVSVLADPVALGAALFVYGAFASLPSPAIAAYIADVVPPKRQQRAYVLQSWAINFGYAIGPIVANQLIKISYSLMFYVEAAVMIAVTILLIVFFREVRHLTTSAPAARPEGAMSRNWRRVLTDTPFLGFSLLMFGYFLVYFQSTSGLPIAMTDLGLGLGDYSVLLTINGGMLCLLQIPAMKLFARMGNSRVLVMGLAVTAIGYAVQAVAHSWGGFALAVVLWTLGELGTFPIATTTVAAAVAGILDTGVAPAAAVSRDKYAALAAKLYALLGGKANIVDIENCVTRLRLGVKDTAKVDVDAIRKLVPGVKVIDDRNVQVVVGTQVQAVADAMEELHKA
jgi:glucose-like phosphotransferase system IIB component